MSRSCWSATAGTAAGRPGRRRRHVRRRQRRARRRTSARRRPRHAARLSAACVERLRPLLVSVATAANPLDLTPTTAFRAGGAGAPARRRSMSVAAEPEIHSLLVHRRLARLEGRRDLRRHRAASHDRAREAGVRQLALAAARRSERLAEPASTPSSMPARGMRAIAPARGARRRPRAGRRARGRRRAPPAFDWPALVPGHDGTRRLRGPLPSHPRRRPGLPVAAGAARAGRGRRVACRRARSACRWC